MANIPALPTGKALWESPTGAYRAYGSHCKTNHGGDAGVDLIDKVTGTTLATWSPIHGATVDLAEITAPTVPYVNAFLKGDDLRVERYWRTGAYRVVGGAPAPKARKAPAKVPPFKGLRDEPEIIPAAPVEAVKPAFVIVTSDIDTDVIPGIESPVKVAVTSKAGYSTVGDIVVPDADLKTLQDAWTLRQSGVPAAVLITGPAGTAKTALARAFAASKGVPFLKVDGGAVRTADDWAGAFRQDPETKTWSHRWSPFARALKRGTPMVVLIDEFNRTESPQAANALMGLIDWTGTLLVPDANAVLTMPPGILVIATANIGPEYVGTLPIDGAVRQRFPYGVRMAYPVETVEVDLVARLSGVSADTAKRLVIMANLQRANRENPQQYPSGAVISTRVVLDIARRIAVCKTAPRDAVVATLRAQFDPGDDKALSVVIDSQFPPTVERDGSEKAREAKAETNPLFVTGKHYFVTFSGSSTAGCDYIFPATGAKCGHADVNSIHSV